MAFGNRLINTSNAGGGGVGAFASGTDFFYSLSLSSSGVITEISSIAGPFNTYSNISIDPVNQVAYMAVGGSGIVSVDISDPSNMTILQTLSTGQLVTAQDLAIDLVNQRAYVVGSGRAASIDISDPSNMSIVSNYYSGNATVKIKLDVPNGIAYILLQGEYYTLELVDISNPNSMTFLNRFYLGVNGASHFELDLVNEVLYFTSSWFSPQFSFSSVDISNSSNITLLDSITDNVFNAANDVSLDLVNNVAYVNGGNTDTFNSIDISNPSNMSILQTFTSANIDGPYSNALDLTNSIAYVPSYISQKIVSVDFSNPSNMVELNTLYFPNRVWNITLS